jgi:phosphoglycerate dehydrogenase-like enzyme
MLENELAEQLPGCQASLAGSEPYTRNIIANAATRGLKVIARAGVGYDGVDVSAATDHGIVVTIAPGTNHDAVAEHTFALMLACAKKVVVQHNLILQGQWPRRANFPLRGRTLSVLGLGRAGKAVARLGKAFGMRVLAYDPYCDAAYCTAYDIASVDLVTALQQGDYITLHMPLLPGVDRVIRAETLQLMKPTAFLINTARGGVIQEADLYEALKHQRIAGAGLDVFDDEPPGMNPLFELPNVVATAHTAGVDFQSRDDMARVGAECIVKLFAGEWPTECVVNPEVRTAWQARRIERNSDT